MAAVTHDLKAALELFEERFLRVQDSRFRRLLESEGKSVEISFDPENAFSPRFVGPREKDTLDFVVLLRAFLPFDEDELVCVKRLRSLYRTSTLPEEIKLEFESIYTDFSRFHDGFTPIRFKSGRLRRKKLFCVFAYSNMIHTRQTQRAIYERWKQDENFFALIESTFLDLLIQYLGYLGRFYMVNSRALKHLESTEGAGP
ncbi:hypothetical protein KAX17_15700 [Candidatus Bipolaricaulota bacterium]|nr:hypothetical protein [Candidatus Bipolaricaulota bacterium]